MSYPHDFPQTVTPFFLLRPARLIGVTLVVLVFVLVLAPWQQSAPASGSVVAFRPMDREQVIDAPVKGRIQRWFVVEGDRVEAGDLIVELADLDPQYFERLERNKKAIEEKLAAAQEQAKAYLEQEKAYSDARNLNLDAAQLKVKGARQKVAAAKQKLEAELANKRAVDANLIRTTELFKEGLASQRSVELAVLADAKAQTAVNTARAAVAEAEASVSALSSERLQKGAEGIAKTTSAQASYRKALSDIAKAQTELQKIETDLSRQSSRMVKAPRSGTVLSLSGNQGGMVVSAGEKLAVLVPSTDGLAVQLWVDGNDAPLITPGRKVRLQFEGWPAVQFVGWPSVAVGTFGGEVAVVDATSRRKGDFRVLVRPDSADQSWPSPTFLRQGVRVKGWVLMNEVRLGYELWRQFNGFPLSFDAEPEDLLADDKSDKDKKKKDDK